MLAPSRVSLKQISTELGIETKRAKKLLRKHGWWLGAKPRREEGRITYDATVIERLRGLLGQEHRQLESPESDWLARHQEEQRNARNQGTAQPGGRRANRAEPSGADRRPPPTASAGG